MTPSVTEYCGPYYVYTSTGALTVKPYTEVTQPFESSWATGTIKKWRQRIAARRSV